ncbi:hypothetical protein CB1_000849060 [Camelus ferus]|nr:hypothetical protein CB1_000849060 [Camelus ferus]
MDKSKVPVATSSARFRFADSAETSNGGSPFSGCGNGGSPVSGCGNPLAAGAERRRRGSPHGRRALSPGSAAGSPRSGPFHSCGLIPEQEVPRSSSRGVMWEPLESALEVTAGAFSHVPAAPATTTSVLDPAPPQGNRKNICVREPGRR